jgi:hypothetical protein
MKGALLPPPKPARILKPMQLFKAASSVKTTRNAIVASAGEKKIALPPHPFLGTSMPRLRRTAASSVKFAI